MTDTLSSARSKAVHVSSSLRYKRSSSTAMGGTGGGSGGEGEESEGSMMSPLQFRPRAMINSSTSPRASEYVPG